MSSGGFFRENEFLYKVQNDVMISQSREFLILVYLCSFVWNFAVKLAFVASVLVIVFSINQYGVNFIHTQQSFNKNCTTFTKELRCLGR